MRNVRSIMALTAAAMLAASATPSATASPSPPAAVHARLYRTQTTVTATVADPRRHLVYAIEPVGLLAVLHTRTGSIRTVVVGSDPADLALDQRTGDVYVTGAGSNDVTIVRGERVLTTIHLEGKAQPSAVLFDPRNHDVYVADSGAGRVSILKGTRLVRSVRVQRVPIGLTVLGRTVYVANAGSSSLSTIRGTTVTDRRIAVGGTPTVLAADTKTRRVFVLDPENATVSVVAGHRERAVTYLEDDANPVAIAVSASTGTEDVIEAGSNAHDSVLAPCALGVLTGSRLIGQTTFGTNCPTGLGLDPRTGDVAVGTLTGRHGLVLHGQKIIATGHVRISGASVTDGQTHTIWAPATALGSQGITRLRLLAH